MSSNERKRWNARYPIRETGIRPTYYPNPKDDEPIHVSEVDSDTKAAYDAWLETWPRFDNQDPSWDKIGISQFLYNSWKAYERPYRDALKYVKGQILSELLNGEF